MKNAHLLNTDYFKIHVSREQNRSRDSCANRSTAHRRHLKNVVEVAVEMVRTKNGSNALLAFVSAEAPLANLVNGLNDKLCEALPSYMISSAYVPMEKMPLTVSGKVDRKQLQGLGLSLSPDQMIDNQSCCRCY